MRTALSFPSRRSSSSSPVAKRAPLESVFTGALRNPSSRLQLGIQSGHSEAFGLRGLVHLASWALFDLLPSVVYVSEVLGYLRLNVVIVHAGAESF